jgi:coproporphyrinogen III oxidase-like Fe-S oxidoreductase
VAADKGYAFHGESHECHAFNMWLKEGEAKETNIFFYNDISEKPFSLFGVGPSARSRIFGYLDYRFEKHKKNFNPLEHIARGSIFGMKYEMIRHIANILENHSRIKIDEIEEIFPENLVCIFKETAMDISEEGSAEFGTNEISLKDSGINSKINVIHKFIDKLKNA